MNFLKRAARVRPARNAVIIERLDPRLILDAPLMLASEGLVLAGPASDPLLEGPALFADATEPDGAPPALPPTDDPLLVDGPLDPEDDPLSPVGDPKPGDGPTSTTSESCGGDGECCGGGEGCNPVTVSVTALGAAYEEHPETPGHFRFSASVLCLIGAPSSVTVNYSLSGTATPVTDYTGALTSGSVTITMNGTAGYADVPFNAVDDIVTEPTESVIATISSGNYLIAPGYAYANNGVVDNEPTVSISAYDGEGVEGETAGIVFEVSRYSSSVRRSVTVNLESPTGTAVEGTDYEAIPRSIEIPAGQYAAQLPVNLLGVVDGDNSYRTIELEIAPSTNYYLGTQVRAGAQIKGIDIFQLRRPIWWFGGEDAASYYESSPLEAGLNTGTWKWEVIAGADKVSLNAGNGGADSDTITEENNGDVVVKSTGGSDSGNDVKIRLTRGDKVVDEHTLTVRQPKQVFVHTVKDEAVLNGYSSTYEMWICDQFTDLLPYEVEVNETFGAWASDFQGENWPGADADSGIADPAVFRDVYSASGQGGTPAPVNPGQPGSDVKVQHATQKYYVGSQESGRGVLVKTHTLQAYRGKARQE